MTSHITKNRFICIIITLTVLMGAALCWRLMPWASSPSQGMDSQQGGNTDLLTQEKLEGSIGRVDETSVQPQGVAAGDIRPQTLVGTWIKDHTESEGGDYPADNNWHLTVTFRDDGRFIWNSRRNEGDNASIDESLTGTYSIEKGFLVSYKFNEPSAEAQQRLPKLFAFWPNKLLGQQTFKFRKDFLVLGYDSRKLWIYLKRSGYVEQITGGDSR